MVDADKKRFCDILKATFEVYGKAPSEAAVNLWWHCLLKFSIDQVAAGVAAHISCPDRGQYSPKPADVIAKISGDRNERKDAGEYAWARVMNAMGSHGTYQSVAFDDPAIHYAIEVAFGDWMRLGKVDMDSPFPRKEFCAAYAAYRPGNGHLKYLPGILERDNSAGGQGEWVPDVVFIGEKTKAKAVMMSGREGIGSPAPIAATAIMANLASITKGGQIDSLAGRRELA